MSAATVEPLTATFRDEAAFIRQAHGIVRDLMRPSAVIFWGDFLASISASYVALYFLLTDPLFSPRMIAAFFIAAFLIYRSSVFTHELAHMAPTRFRAFRIVWNLLFGIPFLMPSYFYTDHRVHHVNQLYATDGDGEYFPFVHLSVTHLVLRLLVVFVIPFLLVARFGLLTVGCLLSPRLRTWVWQKASSIGNLNPHYYRAPADADERRSFLWQETGCCLVVLTAAGLTIGGIVPWQALVKIYAIYVFVMFVNQLRVYAAHHYANESEPMSFLNQMLDSTTIPGGPWSALWAPLGMRFHALHHLFPTMPYHSMGQAHRRLMKQLPPDSPYHATLRPSLLAAIGDLFRASRDYHRRREANAA